MPRNPFDRQQLVRLTKAAAAYATFVIVSSTILPLIVLESDAYGVLALGAFAVAGFVAIIFITRYVMEGSSARAWLIAVLPWWVGTTFGTLIAFPFVANDPVGLMFVQRLSLGFIRYDWATGWYFSLPLELILIGALALFFGWRNSNRGTLRPTDGHQRVA